MLKIVPGPGCVRHAREKSLRHWWVRSKSVLRSSRIMNIGVYELPKRHHLAQARIVIVPFSQVPVPVEDWSVQCSFEHMFYNIGLVPAGKGRGCAANSRHNRYMATRTGL